MNDNLNKDNLLSATKVSQQLDISTKTLDSWYAYYNSPYEKLKDMPELPSYIQHHKRSPRFWKQSDIPALQKFKDWIPKGRKGVMGRVNQKYWSAKYRKADTQNITKN